MTRRPPWHQRLLAWPRFLLGGRADAGHLYDLRGTTAIVADGSVPLVNMGLWDGISSREPRCLERACYAMFALVAEGVGERLRGARVLDAGCGFGTNAVYLAETHGAAQVTGVNVSTVQLASAREHAAASPAAARVDFLHASVTDLPLEDASVDVVVSVEAAFHFDTRARFFAEARRVLRPGGVLSMVDLVVPPARGPLERVALEAIRRSQAVPLANVGDRAAWVAELRAAGFEVEAEESIVARVFPPFRRWILTRPPWEHWRYDQLFMLASLPYLLYPFDYVRVVARRT